VYTATALSFGNGLHGDESRYATIATVAYAPTPRLTAQAGAGVTFGGQLRMPDGDYEFGAGPIAAVGVAYRIVDGRPFLVMSSVLSGSVTTTNLSGETNARTRYEALDLRLGVVAGTTLFDVLSPYAVARVFGGPVFWRYQGRARTGTDVSHVQLGAGAALLIGQRLHLFVEGIPLGEQALSSGLTLAF
jgi:hypothetical protein